MSGDYSDMQQRIDQLMAQPEEARLEFAKSKMRDDLTPNLFQRIEMALTDYWGEECADFDLDCECCLAWGEFTLLKAPYTKEGYELIKKRHFDALAEGFVEIKATSDGMSDQPIADIIKWVLSEIAESKTEKENN